MLTRSPTLYRHQCPFVPLAKSRPRGCRVNRKPRWEHGLRWVGMARQLKPRPYSQKRLSRNSLLLWVSGAGSWYFFHIGWTVCGWFAGGYAALCFIDAVWDMRAFDKAREAKRGLLPKRK